MNQKIFRFSTPQYGIIQFSSQFDNGNLYNVHSISYSTYEITLLPDSEITINKTSSQTFFKSFFHFQVQASTYVPNLKLLVKDQSILANASDSYAPFCRHESDNLYTRIPGLVKIIRSDEETSLHFSHFLIPGATYFSFQLPFTYQNNLEFVHSLQQRISKLNYQINLIQKAGLASDINQPIYFNQQTLTKSYQQRDVHLITISSSGNIIKNPTLNTKYDNFTNKPIIFITCRVHPGESSSSHTLVGIVNFLLNIKDHRACLLRKFFVFQIIPMLNPDGVYNGLYRLDPLGQNLNRFYQEPCEIRQPTIFAAKAYILSIQQNLSLYFDLHGHANPLKHCFVYGNNLEDFKQQIENQLYAKILMMNCKEFDYEHSNFSLKQMNAKEPTDPFGKESCGRVVIQKITNISLSFTLETSFFSHFYDRVPVQNPTRQKKYFQDTFCTMNKIEQNQQQQIIQDEYEDIGKQLLVSILDLISKNPYSRVEKHMEQLKCQVLLDVVKNERFKMQNIKIRKKQLSSLKILNKFESYFFINYNQPKKLHHHIDDIQVSKNNSSYKQQKRKSESCIIVFNPPRNEKQINIKKKRQSSISKLKSQEKKITKQNKNHYKIFSGNHHISLSSQISKTLIHQHENQIKSNHHLSSTKKLIELISLNQELKSLQQTISHSFKPFKGKQQQQQYQMSNDSNLQIKKSFVELQRSQVRIKPLQNMIKQTISSVILKKGLRDISEREKQSFLSNTWSSMNKNSSIRQRLK